MGRRRRMKRNDLSYRRRRFLAGLGICPVCGFPNLRYKRKERDEDILWSIECPKCGFKFSVPMPKISEKFDVHAKATDIYAELGTLHFIVDYRKAGEVYKYKIVIDGRVKELTSDHVLNVNEILNLVKV